MGFTGRVLFKSLNGIVRTYRSNSIAEAQLPNWITELGFDGPVDVAVRKGPRRNVGYWVIGRAKGNGVKAFCARHQIKLYIATDPSPPKESSLGVWGVDPAVYQFRPQGEYWEASGEVGGLGYVRIFYCPQSEILCFKAE